MSSPVPSRRASKAYPARLCSGISLGSRQSLILDLELPTLQAAGVITIAEVLLVLAWAPATPQWQQQEQHNTTAELSWAFRAICRETGGWDRSRCTRVTRQARNNLTPRPSRASVTPFVFTKHQFLISPRTANDIQVDRIWTHTKGNKWPGSYHLPKSALQMYINILCTMQSPTIDGQQRLLSKKEKALFNFSTS